MLVRESIQNAKNFFHKTLQSLKSFFCGGYQKIPKTSILSCHSGSSKNHKTDQFYTDVCNEWEFDLEKAKKRKKNSIMVSEEPVIEEDGSFMQFAKQSPVKNKQEEGEKKEKKLRATRLGKGEEQSNSNQIKSNEGYALAQKMKELDMMDVSDVEHVLDVKEALHYYSQLKSPAYLDIVDNFFMDMYSEFSVPKASVSINNSKRRLGSIRL